ncbi:MAG: hypothetical protein ACK5RL_08870 [Acidimicrobiales bacterium]
MAVVETTDAAPLDLSADDRSRSTVGAPPFHRAPFVLGRVNPTPVVRFVSPSERAVIDQLVESTAGARRAADELVELLFAAADAVDDETRVGLLLPLKRDAYNGRSPDASSVHTLGTRLRSMGFVEAADAVAAWADATTVRDGVRLAIAAGHEAQLGRERARLADYLEHEVFLAALATSGPRLGHLPGRYRQLVDGGRTPSLRDESTPLRYANRAAGKTSPFSWYTATHLLGSDRHGGRLESVLTARRHSHVELGRHLAGVVARDGDGGLHPTSRLTIAGDLHLDGDTLRYTRRDRSGTYAAAELPMSPQIGLVLRQLGACEPGELDLAGLARRLADEVGAPAGTMEAFVRRVAGTGVIRPYILSAEDHDCDAETLIESALRRRHGDDYATDWSTQARAVLDDYRSDLSTATRADARTRLDDLVLSATGNDQLPTGLPVFYEDVVGDKPTMVGDERLDRIVDQFRSLLAGIEIFDDRVVHHRILGATVRRRLEAKGVASLDLSELADLTEQCYEQSLRIVEGVDDPGRTGDRDLVELEALKDRLIDPFVAAFVERSTKAARGVDGSIPGDSLEVRMDPAAVREAADRRPDWLLRHPASYAAFVQPTDPDLGGVVINKLYPGWSAYFSRYLRHCPPAAMERCRSYLASLVPPGREFVETRSIEHFNANVHPLLTDREVARDHTDVGNGFVQPSQIRAGHDKATGGVLLTDEAGTPIMPLYLGFLVPMYLGRLERCLTLMSPNGTIIFEPQVLAERRSRTTGSTSEPGRSRPVHHSPRLVYQDIVLARKRWSVQVKPLLKLLRSTPGAELFGAINEWRVGIGLPETVYITGR